ncbi:uncharacterized protein SPSK_04663 [Sporothrix schenckii 1099-18]|uniref:Uncharacterized protein n=1 Tax=Sporothrix schenckii 1099-18 TaxID=1397361 RepID=A0A0F2LZR7_SPOSC|nr:uncharacterized protein SPSK_04663 [Sporothrix schenckii 1099-18]KJR82943.1 hypothetical protein SPSK_04663 [Sporothrix schenckii 1099-18]
MAEDVVISIARDDIQRSAQATSRAVDAPGGTDHMHTMAEEGLNPTYDILWYECAERTRAAMHMRNHGKGLVPLHSVGCVVNQADDYRAALQLGQQGHRSTKIEDLKRNRTDREIVGWGSATHSSIFGGR